MIQKYSKFKFNGIKAEVNYNKDVTPCKQIKFTIGKESAEMERKDLYALMQLYANDEEMEATLTVKEMKPVTKMMQVTTKEAIPAGGTLKFYMTQELPVEQAEEWEKLNKDKMITQEKAKKIIKKK